MKIKVKKAEKIENMFYDGRDCHFIRIENICASFDFSILVYGESKYEICAHLDRRVNQNRKRAERNILVCAKADPDNNKLVFDVYGTKRLIQERKDDIDKVKSAISLIALESNYDE